MSPVRNSGNKLKQYKQTIRNILPNRNRIIDICNGVKNTVTAIILHTQRNALSKNLLGFTPLEVPAVGGAVAFGDLLLTGFKFALGFKRQGLFWDRPKMFSEISLKTGLGFLF